MDIADVRQCGGYSDNNTYSLCIRYADKQKIPYGFSRRSRKAGKKSGSNS